jgi:oligoendopeptidase F
MEIKQKKRAEIPDQFKWRLQDLYPSDDAWKQAMEAMKDRTAGFEKYRGKLHEAETLLACLNESSDADEELGRLYVYAQMKKDEDTNVPLYQGFADMAQSLNVQLMSAVSFIEPEILENAETVKDFPQTVNGFAVYAHYLDDLLRQKEHVRSAEIEEILANAQEIGGAPRNIFGMLNNADMKFGHITDEDGNTVEVTHARYARLLESRNRQVRQDAYNAVYDSYLKQKNTIAAAYSASVKKDIFFAKVRSYEGALDAALFARNIPRGVYIKLIETVREFLPEMHRYIRLRKKALGVADLRAYDLYTSIVPPVDTRVEYADAKERVLKALRPLGGHYTSAARGGFENGWVDVYENEGKRSGAYSWGSYGGHPYILMNYENKVDDMFTLAHELGHAMHSYYSWSTQPNLYGGHTIFLAEVASTVNEALLMRDMLETTEDPAMRKYLLNEYLEQFRGTVFRQTMFAEFEMRTHEMAEKGEPLTAEALSQLYRTLCAAYYGPEMTLDEKIEFEWGRIPHFYNAFYVYQYATGYSAAMAFAHKILTDTTGQAVTDYIGFLKSGSSDYSIEILKKAGVDMSSPAPVREALKMFKSLLDQMEQLV